MVIIPKILFKKLSPHCPPPTLLFSDATMLSDVSSVIGICCSYINTDHASPSVQRCECLNTWACNFISVCLQCVTTCVWCVIYIQIYMCIYIYIYHKDRVLYIYYIAILYLFMIIYAAFLSCTIYQSYIRLYQPYHFKFSNLNLIISFVFANCFTQTFNILSLNSTSNNAASSPIKCHSWQSRHICWYATYDTLLSYIHITLHFTAQYYTAHILHSSMIFVLPPSRLWTSALNLGLVHISCLVIIHE